MENIITLVMGDPSHDGHNMEEKYTYKSNKTIAEIRDAYSKSCDLLGFNLIDDCCEEYEDSTIEKKYVDILIEHGILHYAPTPTDEGYCPKETCTPCYKHFCIRPADWCDREPKYIGGEWKDGKYVSIYSEVTKGWSFDDGTHTWAELYIAIVKLSLPDLVIEQCSNYKNEIDIGGYGLFWG